MSISISLIDPTPALAVERLFNAPVVSHTLPLPDVDEVIALYNSVGWSAYTNNPESLMRGLANSFLVAIARDDYGQLVGLARILSDGETIAYLQDVLVHPSARRQGIGEKLVTTLFEAVPNARQRILLTDNDPAQKAFYESLGLTEPGTQTPPLKAFIQLS